MYMKIKFILISVLSLILLSGCQTIKNKSGEVAEKVKKVIRDKKGIFDEESKKGIKKELGDVLWYISNLCNEFNFELEEVALQNLEKLKLRAAKGNISGSGDDR